MEAVVLLVIIVALAALGALALRFGYDSRDGVHGPERTVVASGTARPDLNHEQELARRLRAARQVRLARNRVDVTQLLPREGGLARAS